MIQDDEALLAALHTEVKTAYDRKVLEIYDHGKTPLWFALWQAESLQRMEAIKQAQRYAAIQTKWSRLKIRVENRLDNVRHYFQTLWLAVKGVDLRTYDPYED